MPIQTDRDIKANKTDIFIKNKTTKECILIDIPSERNTSVKITENLSKYKDLDIEINRIWGMSTTAIPVIIGVLGLIKKGLEAYNDKISAHINIHEVQKIAFSEQCTYYGECCQSSRVESINYPLAAYDHSLNPAL